MFGSTTVSLLRQISKKLSVLIDNGQVQFDEQRVYQKQSLERLDKIAELLSPPKPLKPTKMQLQFEGEDPMAAGKETDKQTIPCTALETDAAGNPVALDPANVTWAIDKLPDGTDLAELTQGADGSATFKALKVGGPVNVSCTDNAQTPPLVGTNTLEVVASKVTPTSMALVFGDPQAPTA